MKKDGLIITLAWPETWVKATEARYNVLAETLGISKNGFYKVGHAALVLINLGTGQASYFDCGRYDCPPNQARIRSAVSDPDLKLKTSLWDIHDHFQSTELLWEIAQNEATHGSGPMHWGLHEVNFKSSLEFILNEQSKGFRPYGPFDLKGSNCSRFVLKSLVAGGAEKAIWAQLKYGPCPLPIMLTQFSPSVELKMPRFNLNA